MLDMFYFLGGILLWYIIIFMYKTKTGSPSVMSERAHVARLVKYIKPGMRVADMGCGDGAALMAMVAAGAVAGEGWEIEPLVWLRGKVNVERRKLGDRVKVHFGDMWRADLSRYDLVYVYQLTRYGRRFGDKCRREMRRGTLVVANTYPLAGLKLLKKDGKLYVYQI